MRILICVLLAAAAFFAAENWGRPKRTHEPIGALSVPDARDIVMPDAREIVVPSKAQVDSLEAKIDAHLAQDLRIIEGFQRDITEQNEAYGKLAWYLSEAMRQSGTEQLTAYAEKPVYLGPQKQSDPINGIRISSVWFDQGPLDGYISIVSNDDGTVTLERKGRNDQ